MVLPEIAQSCPVAFMQIGFSYGEPLGAGTQQKALFYFGICAAKLMDGDLRLMCASIRIFRNKRKGAARGDFRHLDVADVIRHGF